MAEQELSTHRISSERASTCADACRRERAGAAGDAPMVGGCAGNGLCVQDKVALEKRLARLEAQVARSKVVGRRREEEEGGQERAVGSNREEERGRESSRE